MARFRQYFGVLASHSTSLRSQYLMASFREPINCCGTIASGCSFGVTATGAESGGCGTGLEAAGIVAINEPSRGWWAWREPNQAGSAAPERTSASFILIVI